MWGSVAGGWAAHAAFVDGARRAASRETLLELAAPRPGERVLELACGAGDVGIAAAALVGAGGEVVLSDVAPEMTAIARGRAEALGLGNVRTRELDLEQIDEPDGVLRRRPLPRGADARARPGARGARDPRASCGPGGRVALAVWGPREQNPWLGVVFDAVSAQLGIADAAARHPGPVLALRRRAARRSARRRRPRRRRGRGAAHAVPRRVGRGVVVEDGRARRAARPAAGGAARARTRRRSFARAREAISAYETPDGLEIPGVSLIASGTRA